MIELLFFHLGGSFVIAFYRWINKSEEKEDDDIGVVVSMLIWPLAFFILALIKIINTDYSRG